MLRGDDELYYLMRVLRNTFLTTRRTAARRPLTVATLEDVVTADARPTGRPEQALEISELYATIAELPDDFRLALVAVDVLGLSYKEAARALGAREATITTRLFRARRQVTQRLVVEEPIAAAPSRDDPPRSSAAAAAASRHGAPTDDAEERAAPDSGEQTPAHGVLQGRKAP
jgi:predicted DNA-binding protein (UPF0251 family)